MGGGSGGCGGTLAAAGRQLTVVQEYAMAGVAARLSALQRSSSHGGRRRPAGSRQGVLGPPWQARPLLALLLDK